MTFLNYGQVRKKGLGWVNMINRAGNLVEPNATTVGSAMNDFSDWFDDGEFNIDIYDAGGANSWPFSFISYFSINKDVQTFDCTNIQEQLNFVSWTYTNDAYVCFCLRV
jgi:ABC-type phosphate transport system substrate-binding protein